jgi:hypothetical protein
VVGQSGLAESNRPSAAALDGVMDELRQVLTGIEHGSVTLIVQDGRVIQIDATRKVRLGARRSSKAGRGDG